MTAPATARATPQQVLGWLDEVMDPELPVARVAVPCPQCGSSKTRWLSQFGSTARKALYRCNSCLVPFEYFKPH